MRGSGLACVEVPGGGALMAAVRLGTLTTPGRMFPVITCHLRYEIDPSQTAAFEKYATGWIPVVTRFGGTHHGCYLPHEGANDIAYALFSFPSLAAYENYRTAIRQDPETRNSGSSARRPAASVASTGPSSAQHSSRQRRPKPRSALTREIDAGRSPLETTQPVTGFARRTPLHHDEDHDLRLPYSSAWQRR